jgi:hypothetical protein
MGEGEMPVEPNVVGDACYMDRMQSISAHDLDRRLTEMVRRERHLVVQFVVELASFAQRELYRELGYSSLFYYCLRQLGLSKSSAFRRSEAARLIARFPAIADLLREGRLSIRSLVELREVLTEENHAEVLARAAGISQEEAQLLAVELKPRPVPRDVARVLPMPLVSAETKPGPSVSAETGLPPAPPATIKPLTPQLRLLSVTVSAEFMAELEQARAALSHKFPDGDFERVVREGFKLLLERDRKRKGLTERPREQVLDRAGDSRYVSAAVKRAVWERDQGRCTWPMGDRKFCGSTHQLEFDHDLEVALGGGPTIDNIHLLCKSHNLMKAENRFGREFMARFRGNSSRARPSTPQK